VVLGTSVGKSWNKTKHLQIETATTNTETQDYSTSIPYDHPSPIRHKNETREPVPVSYMVMPPSMVMMLPFMKATSSEQANKIE
jgi:hypothetical protein